MTTNKKERLKNKEEFKHLSRAEDDGFPIADVYKKDIVEICDEESENTQNK